MKVKAAIFDLDMTLVNSSAAASLRKAMKWTQVYKKIPSFDLYPGVPELLQQLTNNRIRQCIVTSASEEYCKRVLGHFRVQPEISICYHHTKRHKPHPEPIQLALDKLDLSPSEAFSIGDEPHDITASRSAGVPAFAALALDPALPTFTLLTRRIFNLVLPGGLQAVKEFSPVGDVSTPRSNESLASMS